MKVKAKFPNGKFGFYGGARRRDGDVFELEDDKHFSAKWMVKVEEKQRKSRSPASEATETNGEGAE
jgi:hypothetical protein